MRRSLSMRLAAPLVAVALAVSACGGTSSDGGAAKLGATNDINPHDVSELRDGGDLRLAISSLPENWNSLHNDGNNSEYTAIEKAMMPRAFSTDAAGKLTLNTDYFTAVELTGESPQQVTYTINPKAVWSDGSPITWEDIKFQAEALSGRNKEFQIAGFGGFDRVDKVERGVDDRQAVLTFGKHYAEWRGQFAGNSMLYPKQVTATPQAFNTALLNGPGLTAGPFTVTDINLTDKRVVLGRNQKWWGATPKLDTITFRVLDVAAWVPALVNNELDAVGLADREEVTQARSAPGVVIRRTPGMLYTHVTFNGAEGSILADPKLRVALMRAIDRKSIVTSRLQGLVDGPVPLGNHVYLAGQEGYQDNGAEYGFDPDRAARELDALGWRLVGDTREKDGRKLVIRNVSGQSDAWVQMAQIIQQDFAKIGVKLVIETKPSTGFFPEVIQKGNFDFAMFSWVGDTFPLSGLPQIYRYDPNDLQGNYGRIGTPELNDLIERTISELDPAKAIELANEVDRKVWELGFSALLYQTPGVVGVRDKLANFGPAGLATIDYTKIGFLK